MEIATTPFELMFKCFFLLLLLSHRFCNCSDTISTSQSLSPNQTIVSKQGKFELGFFSPGDSTNHYVAIWYKNIKMQPVWVANRNHPISSSFYNSSRLELDSNGSLNLIVNSARFWTLPGALNATEAVILDTGNLVLRSASGVVWQSFDHPTGTWLPGGVIGVSESEAKLISWRNGDDPGTGNYSLTMERNGGGELFLKKNGSQTIWRSGVWKNGSFSSFSSDLYNFSYVSRDGAEFVTYDVYKSAIVRILMHPSGLLYHYVWSEARRDWFTLAVQPPDLDCCGGNAMCDVNYSPPCRCLDGFVPRVKRDWDLFNFSNGCVRERALKCEKENTVFTKLSNVGWRGSPESRSVGSSGECESVCLADCSCSAYASSGGGGGVCLLFKGELLDLETLQNNSSGADLFIRMESGDVVSGKGGRKVRVVALVVPIATIAIVVFCFCFCFCFFYLWPKLKSKEHQSSSSPPCAEHQNLLLVDLNPNGRVVEKNSQYDLPGFSFSSIAAATNNFSDANKLGEGGFGPVYKGELVNGKFVAVKRLSRSSGQGVEEFMNEVKVISKLQHRNLVKLIGCCVESEEKMLVYEYMPNGSLDAYLFNSHKRQFVAWKKCKFIIEGICRGLVYLHRDSRLRIIHRDLKASNILLDEELNPKISDFGMARIFGDKDDQGNTKKVVGTRGYMSPEYTLHGIFSEKSDVYSFGVLLLEIVFGRKNSKFYDEHQQLHLIPYAWKLWNEGRITSLMDPAIYESDREGDVVRYGNVGLLCVQEIAADRPNISTVLSMLSYEIVDLPRPKQPAFLGMQMSQTTHSSTKSGRKCSVNDVTISSVEGR